MSYVDEEFIICMERLIPENLDNQLYNHFNEIKIKECLFFQWHRIDKIFPNCKIFLSNQIKIEDLNQSSYGGCYFLVALAGLINTSKKDLERFKRIFLTNDNNKGIYAVNLFLQGEPKVVAIDDMIPCKFDKDEKLIPAFSSSPEAGSAVLILEKAWAKFNDKCYLKTWQGTTHEALTALCEAPCVFEFNKAYLNKNKADLLWKKLVEANKKKWILSTNTEDAAEGLSNKEENMGNIGLPKFHAFSILNIYEIKIANYDEKTENLQVVENDENVENQQIQQNDICKPEIQDYSSYLRLIKLRNTTNTLSNFTGLFEPNSPLLTDTLKRILNFDKNFYQGTMIITYEEYLKFFPWTFICKYEDSYFYRYAKFTFNNPKTNNDISFIQKIETSDLKNYNTYPGHSKKLVPCESKYENNLNQINQMNQSKHSIDDRIFYTNDFYLNEYIIQEKETSNDPINLSHISIDLSQQKNYYTEKPKSSENSELRIKQVNSYKTTNKNKSEDDVNINCDLSNENKNNKKDNFIFIKDNEAQKDYKREILWSDLNNLNKQIDKYLLDIDQLLLACIDIPEGRTKCYITLHQPQLRYYSEKIKDFKVPLAFIIIAKFNPEKKSYKFINSEFINWEKLVLECDLVEGEYHIFAKSYWNYSDAYELVLSTYAEVPCILYKLIKDEIPCDWLEKIMIYIVRKNPKKEIMKTEAVNLLSSNVIFNNNNYCGFSIFYYENSSERANMVINLKFMDIIGFECLNFNLHDIKKLKLIVGCKKSAYLIFRIFLLPWICKLNYVQEIWFEQPYEFIVSRYYEIGLKNQILVQEGIRIDCIPHERGYLLVTENQTDNKYNAFFTFENLNNYEIEDHSEVSSVILILEQKSRKFINIKGTCRDLDPNFILNYKYNFEKIES